MSFSTLKNIVNKKQVYQGVVAMINLFLWYIVKKNCILQEMFEKKFYDKLSFRNIVSAFSKLSGKGHSNVNLSFVFG